SLIARIDQQSDPVRARDYFDPECQLFSGQSLYGNQRPGDTASWPSLACGETRAHRIDQADADNCDSLGCLQGRECRRHASSHEETWFEPTQFVGNYRKPLDLPIRISLRDIEVPPLDVTKVSHRLQKAAQARRHRRNTIKVQNGDERPAAW